MRNITITENALILIEFGVVFCISLILMYVLHGIPLIKPEDSYQHFLMAKYSVTRPEFFFHLWGKPVYTLIATPISQLGFHALQIFNILCGIVTALLTRQICIKLKLRFCAIIIPLLCLNYGYLTLMISTLPEILFSLLLIISINLLLNKQITAAVILASFLPFVRHEGLIIIILYAIFLIKTRAHKKIPLLFIGILCYMPLGIAIYGVHSYFSQFYQPWEQTAGTISLLNILNTAQSYIQLYFFTLGLPVILLALFGGIRLFRIKDASKKTILSLILFIYLANLFIQIIISSCSFTKIEVESRLIASFSPLLIILCTYALSEISKTINSKVALFLGTLSLVVAISMSAINIYTLPRSQVYAVFDTVKDWIITNNPPISYRHIISYNPYFYYICDRNPWDIYMPIPTIQPFSVAKFAPALTESIKKSTIILWDSNGGIYFEEPAETLKNNPQLELAKTFITSDHKQTMHLFRFKN